MPSHSAQSPESGGINWLAVLRTLAIQLVVLLAMSAAVVRYFEWSSDQNWAEFTTANRSSLPHAMQRPPAVTPVEAIKRKVPCQRGA